jgi:hypothetical protein
VVQKVVNKKRVAEPADAKNQGQENEDNEGVLDKTRAAFAFSAGAKSHTAKCGERFKIRRLALYAAPQFCATRIWESRVTVMDVGIPG